MRRRSVTILGSFGGFNAGDDAILYAVASSLRRELPSARIRAVSSCPSKYINDLSPLDVDIVGKSPLSRSEVRGSIFRAPPLAAIYRMRFGPRYWGPGPLSALLRSDAAVLCGGVFHDHRLQDAGFNIMSQWKGALVLASRLGVPIVTFNSGMGPLRTDNGRRTAAAILRRSPFISLREEEGAALLDEIGVKAPVYIGADPALSLVPTSSPPAGGSGQVIPVRPSVHRIGINVSSYLDTWTDRVGSVSIEDLARSLASAVSRIERAAPVVICTNTADEAISRSIAEAFGDGAPVLSGLDHHGVLAAVSSVDLMLGMRLHSCVFSVASGVPVVGLDYAPKVGRFLGQVGLGELAVPIDSSGLAELPAIVAEAWRRRREFGRKIEETLPGLRARAEFPAAPIGRIVRGEDPGPEGWSS